MPNSQKNQKYNLSKKEIDFNNQMYRDFISTYGETAEGLGWHSQQQQEKRFEIMLKILDFSKKPMKGMSVLDVGCGMGRFMEIAANHGAIVIGVDLSFAVETARLNLKKRRNCQDFPLTKAL